jgi:peptide/nickel transport system substrate-binding protein
MVVVTATPGPSPTPIIITVAGTPMVVTATPGPTSIPAPTSAPIVVTATSVPFKPSGTLSISVPNMGNENWVFRNAGGVDARVMWSHLSDPLWGIDRVKGSTEFSADMGIMDSWNFNITPTEYTATIVIKKGIPFHNDEGVVTAEDLKFTYTAYLEEGSISSDANTKKTFLDNNADNVTVIDNKTVKFNLARNFGFEFTLRQHLGEFEGVFSKAYMERVGEDGFQDHPIGTGPFRFIEHRSDQKVTLEAVLGHWRQTPAYDRLIINKVPDAATRLAQLLSGQAAIVDVSPQQMAQVIRNSDTRVMTANVGNFIFGQLGGLYLKEKPGCESTCGTLDTSIPWVGEDPLAEGPMKVRKAMNLAINRQGIVDSLLLGLGSPGATPFGFDDPSGGWYNPNWQPYPYDPDLARQLMAEAGYADGFSMEAYAFELPTSPLNDDMALAVAGMWEKELGIKVTTIQTELRPVVLTHLIDRTLGQRFMNYTGQGNTPPDRAAVVVYGSKGFVAYFEHEETDRLTELLRNELDTTKRDVHNRAFVDFIYDNHYSVPIAGFDAIWGLHNDYIGTWPKTPGQSWIGDMEYVTRP